jgi:hypothetical protein
MGDYQGAKDAYFAALNYGEDSLPYENLASLALVYGDPKSTIDFIQHTALKNYPEDGLLWTDLAILLYRYENTQLAKSAIEKAKIYSHDPTTNFIAYIINNNKKLGILIKNGEVTFYTE